MIQEPDPDPETVLTVLKIREYEKIPFDYGILLFLI